MLVEEPTLADARVDLPRANGVVDPQADIVSGRERQLECLIKQQTRQIEKLEARIEEMEDHFGRQLAEIRREIATPPIQDKTAQDHLDRLFSEMRRLGLHQVAITDAARILAISKRQMANVKPSIKSDPRFALVIDPKIHKQRHLIRIV